MFRMRAVVFILVVAAVGCARKPAPLPHVPGPTPAPEDAAINAPTWPYIGQPNTPDLPSIVVEEPDLPCGESKSDFTSCLDACHNRRERRACLSLQRTCEGGHPQACIHAAITLEQAEGKATPQVVRYLDAACEGGQTFGCVRLVSYFKQGHPGVTANAAKAETYAQLNFAIAKAECEGAKPYACISLGYLYQEGLGTEPDADKSGEAFARGFRRLRAKCDADDAFSCHMLGAHYSSGNATPVDHKLGRHYLTRACEIPWPSRDASCKTLIQQYGTGLDENIERATDK